LRYSAGVPLERSYDMQVCSIARSLEVIGDRWTILILRDTMFRGRRFDDLQHSLGLARNVLTERLQRLCDEGVLERRPYQDRPLRYEYMPTQKAHDLWPVLSALLHWGDSYYAPAGPPRLVVHRDCGGSVVLHSECATCGAEVTADNAETRPGPGARPPAAAHA
jgi:DNA-binding HxlR family transcriptional regulator